ncbi:MAG: hypothetical protein AAFR16_13870, partial [Pseudomonadota bacterium]
MAIDLKALAASPALAFPAGAVVFGADGPDAAGPSVYDAAALQGPVGPQGPAGPTGPAGAPGAAGAT